jgi:hypothetical protein
LGSSIYDAVGFWSVAFGVGLGIGGLMPVKEWLHIFCAIMVGCVIGFFLILTWFYIFIVPSSWNISYWEVLKGVLGAG